MRSPKISIGRPLPFRRRRIRFRGPEHRGTIAGQNFATMVLPDEECASACALIWISSYRRYMSASSKIGFHAAYTTVDGKPRETGMGNAEIGSYLTISASGLRLSGSSPMLHRIKSHFSP